jgi:hypothetical protein
LEWPDITTSEGLKMAAHPRRDHASISQPKASGLRQRATRFAKIGGPPALYLNPYFSMNLPSVRFHISNRSLSASYVPPGERSMFILSHGSLSPS